MRCFSTVNMAVPWTVRALSGTYRSHIHRSYALVYYRIVYNVKWIIPSISGLASSRLRRYDGAGPASRSGQHYHKEVWSMTSYSDTLRADHAHLLHPLYHPTAHQQPKIWVSGSGAILTDSEGGTYIDGLSGLWCVNVGHGRHELAAAARQQMDTLAYCSSYAGSSNLPAIQLAERLSALVYPSINSFFFTSGGAEASESSFKTARFYWKTQGRPDKVKIISRMHGYHGVTMAAMSATGLPAYWPMFEPRVPHF